MKFSSYLMYALMSVILVLGFILFGWSGLFMVSGAIAGGFVLGLDFAAWIAKQDHTSEENDS